jgi:type I restriction-modification system DNA methylase subunit
MTKEIDDNQVTDLDKDNAILTKTEKKKQFGEVFTPVELVNEILDQLPPEVWLDPTKTWLDNSCGAGVFLVEVKRRLMTSLATWEPDPVKLAAHILDKQIYGVELQRDNWIQCRINLGLTPTGNDGNIVNTDALEYSYTFLKDDQGGYKLTDSTFDDLFEF